MQSTVRPNKPHRGFRILTTITTITELLESTGDRLRFFDMGRRVQKIPHQQFVQFEKTAIAYPFPMQQQAWFAMLFQDEGKKCEPFIWFLRFPLDEQGKLVQAARDDFMHRLVERLDETLAAQLKGEQLEAALEDNPYSFKPKEERLAPFHAKVSRLMKQPPSKFYAHAQTYFSGKLGWDQWSSVGYQGIADIAARMDQGDNEDSIIRSLPHIEPQPLVALCHCLENEATSQEVTQALLSRAELELEKDTVDLGVLTATLRGAAQSRSTNLRKEFANRLLSSSCGNHIELLAALSGRAWEWLEHDTIRMLFLERLAENNAGQNAFSQCMADLMYMPGLRAPLLTSVRNPDRSEKLSQAIGVLFQEVSEQQAPPNSPLH